jgi:hypothetical protein
MRQKYNNEINHVVKYLKSENIFEDFCVLAQGAPASAATFCNRRNTDEVACNSNPSTCQWSHNGVPPGRDAPVLRGATDAPAPTGGGATDAPAAAGGGATDAPAAAGGGATDAPAAAGGGATDAPAPAPAAAGGVADTQLNMQIEDKRQRLLRQQQEIGQKQKIVLTRNRMLNLSQDSNRYNQKLIYTFISIIFGLFIIMLVLYVHNNKNYIKKNISNSISNNSGSNNS